MISIDHTILSPSGHTSKRARDAALDRERDRLFPPGYWDALPKTEAQLLADKIAQLRRQITRLRDLADRGMSTRKFRREADKLEREVQTLEAS